MKQEHQLDHMEIIYTSLQTALPAPYHLIFYRPDALADASQLRQGICKKQKVVNSIDKVHIPGPFG